MACIVDSSHQQYLNNGWDHILNWNMDYYNDIIKLLCMLSISGNWWPPEEVISPININNKKEIKRRIVFNKNGEIYLNFSQIKGPTNISIYNLSGRELFSETVKSPSSFIPLNKYFSSNGIFVLKIDNTEGMLISEKVFSIR